MTMKAIPSILVVDDDSFFRERLIKAFVGRNYDAFGAANYQEALESMQQKQPEMALVDLKMPGKSGLELIREMNNRQLSIRTVVLTGYGSIATAIEAVKLGAVGYVSKPADVDEILAAFQKKEGAASAHDSSSQEKITTPSLARVEWEHINRILADCDGNISQAAKRLGLHRRSLQRKLLKYPPKV